MTLSVGTDKKTIGFYLKCVFSISRHFMAHNQCPLGLGSETNQLVAADASTQHELQKLTSQV